MTFWDSMLPAYIAIIVCATFYFSYKLKLKKDDENMISKAGNNITKEEDEE